MTQRAAQLIVQREAPSIVSRLDVGRGSEVLRGVRYGHSASDQRLDHEQRQRHRPGRAITRCCECDHMSLTGCLVRLLGRATRA